MLKPMYIFRQLSGFSVDPSQRYPSECGCSQGAPIYSRFISTLGTTGFSECSSKSIFDTLR